MDHLVAYAQSHGLDVRVGVEARRLEPDGRSGWTVATSEGPWSARHVIVATGWDAEPKLPPWAAQSRFAGPVLHTSELTDLTRFRGQRVVIVGAGSLSLIHI